jgi:hypothetical protein
MTRRGVATGTAALALYLTLAAFLFARSSAPQFANLLAGTKSLYDVTPFSSIFQNCNPEERLQ